MIVNSSSWLTVVVVLVIVGSSYRSLFKLYDFLTAGRQVVSSWSTSSILLTIYSVGSLKKISEGILEGCAYRLLVSEPVSNDIATLSGESAPGIFGSGHIIMIYDLPKPSMAHIAGFGLRSREFTTALAATSFGNSMREVKLEGDFPDYFKLFCDPDYEVELREILSPDTMQFLVDFCTKLQWEILGPNVYFTQVNKAGTITEDGSGIAEASEQFIKQILPVIAKL